MARPKLTNPTIYKNIGIPQDLCARLELELYSDLEGKIPFGAQQEFFTMLLRSYFDRLDSARDAEFYNPTITST